MGQHVVEVSFSQNLWNSDIKIKFGYIDVGDKWMLVPDANVKKIKVEHVDDENSQNRHQHLKVVANTFRLHYPSPTSMYIEKLKSFRVRSERGSRNWAVSESRCIQT